MIHKRIVQETVKIKTLFDNCGVPNVPKAITIIPFGLNVKTPYGFKRIDHIFRTPIEETVTTYFTNNKTLKTSPQHRVKVDNNWKYVSELTETDIIETEQGFTRLRSQKYHKPESLYDIAVDDVHCYYSNGILSHNSWFLAKLGTNALKSGKTVLHYTLELADIYTAKRYDSLLCGIPFNDLKYHQETIQNTVSKLKGKLFIKEFPPATLSLTALEAHIEKFILSGVKPDLLIIDYPELLKINYTGERDDKVLGQLYTDIRGLSGRFNMATWVVDQTNRSQVSVDVIGNDGISNSFAKIFIADVVMTLSRKAKDKVNKTARLHLSKSRLGPDGLTFPMRFDTYSPIIEVYPPDSSEGKKVKDDTLTDQEFTQKTAAAEYERQQKRKGLF
jgi:hypothetical protein